MFHSKLTAGSGNATRVSVQKEMAKPRMAKSVRTAAEAKLKKAARTNPAPR
jgi:hypothetical protein